MRAQAQEDVLLEWHRLARAAEERIQARNEGLDVPTRVGLTERQIHSFLVGFSASFIFFLVLI